MRCIYINLDAAHARRTRIEGNFSEYRREGWRLQRFAAIDATQVEVAQIAGSLRATEKACFLSHRGIIQESLGDDNPILLLEDDATFGRHTCQAIDRFVLSTPGGWDIAFTDLCVPHLPTMIELVRLRQRLAPREEIAQLELAQMPFCGATAYVVNGRLKKRLAELLSAPDHLSIPYDLYLRDLIHARQLTGVVFFPFVTSLSEFSERSQIQPGDEIASTDLIWNTFRKLIWMDRDLKELLPLVEDIGRNFCDEESRLFGALFAAMASAHYRPK